MTSVFTGEHLVRAFADLRAKHSSAPLHTLYDLFRDSKTLAPQHSRTLQWFQHTAGESKKKHRKVEAVLQKLGKHFFKKDGAYHLKGAQRDNPYYTSAWAPDGHVGVAIWRSQCAAPKPAATVATIRGNYWNQQNHRTRGRCSAAVHSCARTLFTLGRRWEDSHELTQVDGVGHLLWISEDATHHILGFLPNATQHGAHGQLPLCLRELTPQSPGELADAGRRATRAPRSLQASAKEPRPEPAAKRVKKGTCVGPFGPPRPAAAPL